MAKLAGMPQQAIVDGFKGTIDFYLWMGIPVARSWPRRRTIPFTPQEKANWPLFATAVKVWANSPVYVQDAYRSMSSASSLSGRDLASKLYLNATTILTNLTDNAFRDSG